MKKGFLLQIATTLALLPHAFGQIPLAEEKVMVTNERRVNSDELEFSPVFYKDGIVFITTRFESVMYNVKDKNAEGKNIMSIWRSQRDEEGFLQEPFPLADELLSRVHEGPVTFDATAQTIFFTRNNGEVAPDNLKKLQIFKAVMQGDKWENIEKLPFQNPHFNYSHPTISADGNALFMASDIPGGFGGMDLYVSYQDSGQWSNLINLGEQVNTAGNEVFPYAAADGTLYFASDGHGGMGGLDLFYTQESSAENWGRPVTLGFPFNAETDDFGFIVDRDNKNGYFSSDRTGGFGDDDIYSFHIEGDIFIAGVSRKLDGMVVLDENGNPLEGAAVRAIQDKEIAISTADQSLVKLSPSGDHPDDFILQVNADRMGEKDLTDAQGKPDLALKGGNYVLKVSKEGYVPQYIVVTPETDLNSLQIQLQRAVGCIPLVGTLLMDNRHFPISGAAVYIVDVETKESVTVYTDDRGQFEYCVKCNRTYTVYAKKDDVTSAPVVASGKDQPCSADSRIGVTLYMSGTPLYAGMTIRLPNIYFNYDDAALRPDAYTDLNEVVSMLNSYPGMKLELASHTDSRGGDAYNQDLSERRSQSVFKYLTGKGVPANRLTPRGYGESQLRNRCKDGVACNEQEHQYNRRTEVKILELGEPVQSETQLPGVAHGDSERPGNEVESERPGNEVESERPGNEVLAMEQASANENKGGGDEGITVKVASEKKAAGSKSEKEVEAGSFTVIAGTFSNYSYAQRRQKLLEQLGYGDSEIVKQERNGLYAVWVKSYEVKNEAFELVRKLAQQQLHSYVLRR